MPKVGIEPASLVNATIAEIGRAHPLEVTVAQIDRAAGMSTALAYHYFGGKDKIFRAAMRHIRRKYSGEVRNALAGAPPPARVQKRSSSPVSLRPALQRQPSALG